MIVLVDNEHETGYAQPWGQEIMANRVRIKYRLEDLSGHECLIVRWNRVSPELLERIEALRAEGVATIEIKSGYGLNIESELKMLAVARQLGDATPVTVRTTLLAA